MNKLLPLFSLTIISLYYSPIASSQDIHDKLKALETLVGGEWHGEVNDLNIKWSMTPIQNGKAIRKELKIIESDFTSETIFYWDIKNERISFLRITVQGFILDGEFTAENNIISLSGHQAKDNSQSRFTNTLEIMGDKLIDIWYDDAGKQQHYIEFSRK